MRCPPPTRQVAKALARAGLQEGGEGISCREAGEHELGSGVLPGEREAAALCSCSAAFKARLYILGWGPLPASGRERVGRN